MAKHLCWDHWRHTTYKITCIWKHRHGLNGNNLFHVKFYRIIYHNTIICMYLHERKSPQLSTAPLLVKKKKKERTCALHNNRLIFVRCLSKQSSILFLSPKELSKKKLWKWKIYFYLYILSKLLFFFSNIIFS